MSVFIDSHWLQNDSGGQPSSHGKVHQRKVLGGIINDYYRAPTQTSLYLN
jgi:hypothetical protein